MSSSNHRSSNSRSSRRPQLIAYVQPQRSASAPPNRQFIIILTNNPELLRQTRPYRPRLQQSSSTNNGNNDHTNNNREVVLNDLLRLELREAAVDYLRRTHRTYPIHYVFDMSDINSDQMSRSNRPATPYVPVTTRTEHQYFIITLTNFPNLLRRTSTFQQAPNQQWQQYLRDGTLTQVAATHFNTIHTEEQHEAILYNTLRFELEECVRAYLQRTGRLYPINLIFGFSHIERHS
ncbi:unnamed protein product [Rotaria sp. Silwood2]|nr:unnamed protein product [Rotaria sp. Silwood2]CAF3407347.1 unnamed protein product [Rotaria sp. Silwood2]CAF4374685.1 unnamed protein product [Rotaria sp. Silwood2]CAF4455538.1 unnamed protein product [Rotaria sp. Silwood2]